MFWLKPPVFEDDEKTRAARLLHIISLASIVLTLVYLIVALLFTREPRALGYAAAVIILALGINILARRGHIKVANIGLVTALWFIISLAFLQQGLYHSSFSGYLIPILFAGFLIGERASLGMATLSTLMGLAVLVSGSAGPVTFSAQESILRWVTHTAFFYISAVVISLATSNIRDALKRARQSERVLVERNQQLEQEMAEHERAEERFLKAFYSSPIPITISTLDEGRFVEVNESCLNVLGYQREEMIGHTALELQMWADIRERDETLQLLRQHGTLRQREIRFRARSGEVRYGLASFEIIELNKEKHLLGTWLDITDRKRMEERLRESEEEFRQLSDAALEGISISEQGRIILANIRIAQMFGYEHSELIGKPVLDLVAPSSRDLVEARMRQGYDHPYDHLALRKDGSVFPVEVCGRTMSYGGRQVQVAALRDITERKQAEEKLQTNAEAMRQFSEKLKSLHEIGIQLSQAATLDDLYRQAIELGRSRLGFDRLGLWLIDEENQQMTGTFGTDIRGQLRDERGLRHSIAHNERVAEALRNKARAAVWEDVPLYDTWEIVGHGWNAMAVLWHGDKSIGWIAADNLLHGDPLQPYQLELLTLYGTTLGHLLTRRQAEEALKRSEERFFKAFHVNPTAISITTLDEGRFVDINESFLNFTGFAREELIGRRSVDLNFWNDDKDRVTTVQALAQERTMTHSEAPFTTRSGEARYGLTSMEIIEIGGEPHLLSMIQDITEIKRAQQQALELTLVRERENNLREFLATISHDLKTPLSVINTSLYMLERIADPDKQKSRIETIKTQTLLLEKYIQDILTISRLDHTPTLTRRPVDLNRLLSEIITRLRPAAERKNLTTTLDIGPGATTILGDEQEVERVLVNLIENALIYTPAGGSVTVRTIKNGSGIIAEISDTGMGIKAEDLPHIFERFYRSSEARELEKRGTGLGLAIVKKIVELHDGSIEVESAVGRGTTFRVWLPGA